LKYPVVEIFPSIQGEGQHIGMPCVFIRLYGCNLACKWCDTPQAIATAKDDTVKGMTAKEIVDMIDTWKPSVVVLTGGEPLIHKLKELLIVLRNAWYSIDIETNGTLKCKDFWMIRHFAVSPKLPSSSMWEHRKTDVLRWYTELGSRKVSFKFVVAHGMDYNTMVQLVEDLDWQGLVYVQPVNNDVEIARDIAKWLIQDKLWQYRLLPQWHKYLEMR